MNSSYFPISNKLLDISIETKKPEGSGCLLCFWEPADLTASVPSVFQGDLTSANSALSQQATLHFTLSSREEWKKKISFEEAPKPYSQTVQKDCSYKDRGREELKKREWHQ